MVKAEDLELSGLRLDLVDLVSAYTNAGTGYISYMYLYEDELEALVGLPEEEQRKGLKDIAHKVIASYKRDKDGGRKDG